MLCYVISCAVMSCAGLNCAELGCAELSCAESRYNQFFWEGAAKFYPSEGGGRSFGPKGREPGEGLGLWGSAIDSPSGSGRCNFRPQTSLQMGRKDTLAPIGLIFIGAPSLPRIDATGISNGLLSSNFIWYLRREVLWWCQCVCWFVRSLARCDSSKRTSPFFIEFGTDVHMLYCLMCIS